MTLETRNKLNQLLQMHSAGGLLFSDWLRRQGYSDQLLQQYRTAGWLCSLASGVMYRTGESPSAYAAIASYDEQCGKRYRIAAHSALELFGYNHYVPMGKPVLMVAHEEAHTPVWMKSEKFDRTIKTFTTNAFSELQNESVQVGNWSLTASSPEQAFLECLLLAPKQYALMDLYYIMEQLTTLRPDKLQTLLETTTNNKVKRLFLYMAEKAGHYWFDSLDTSRIEIGTSKLQLVKGGTYVPKYKMTIPKELKDYE